MVVLKAIPKALGATRGRVASSLDAMNEGWETRVGHMGIISRGSNGSEKSRDASTVNGPGIAVSSSWPTAAAHMHGVKGRTWVGSMALARTPGRPDC